MFVRRRPLLRAAVVGGGAYMAGKNVARRSAERESLEEEQNERISDLEQQQAQQAPDQEAQQAPGLSASSPMIDQLNQLASLHQQGALTDDEFAAAKARLIGT
jgi:Short C-terminal domain